MNIKKHIKMNIIEYSTSNQNEYSKVQYIKSEWILKSTVHKIKMNIKKYSTSNQNEY